MDVDSPDEMSIGFDFLTEEEELPKSPNEIFIKQTLLPSPIITNIIPKFRVQINKPFKGVTSVLFNDEEYQTLIPKEEDSQMDAFSDNEDFDDDLLMETTQQNIAEPEIKKHNILKEIQVIVKHSALFIDGIEFLTKSEIRSSCIIKGLKDETNEEEDMLFISLKSGYLLLLKLYYVPRHYKDTDYEYQSYKEVTPEGNSIFKPFVVQWWNTSGGIPTPFLESSGHLLRSSASGLSTVSCSASRSFRLYMTQNSKNGSMLRNHVNVSLDGELLDGCFIEPNTNSKTDMFMTLIFTHYRRLQIELFSWNNFEGLSQSFSKSILPLMNTFEIPVFIIPLKNNASFLFVTPSHFTVVTIHHIISAQYNFSSSRTPWTSAFPTSYHIPNQSTISTDIDKIDQIFISTDAGIVHSILISNNNVVSHDPILRVYDKISIFTLEKQKDKYRFIYSSDTGSSKDLLIPHLFTKEDFCDLDSLSKLPYTNARLVKDFKNWSPLVDVEIVDCNRPKRSRLPARQEVWGISGCGKKSKLNQFQHGYSAIRKGNTYYKLRKADKIYYLIHNDIPYTICSLPFESILLEFQENSQESFAEISNPKINTAEITLLATVIPTGDDSLILQVCPATITISNLVDFKETKKFDEFSILFCDKYQDLLIVITDSKGVIDLRVWRLSVIENEDGTFSSEFLEPISSRQIQFQPSALKVFRMQDETRIVIGTFDGELISFSIDNNTIQENRTYNLNQLCPYTNDETISLDLVIPHEIIVIENSLYIGSKEGHYIQLEIQGDFISCKRFLRIGEREVTFCVSQDPKLIFINCKSLWLVNHYESSFPTPVCFDDNYERSVRCSVEIAADNDNSKSIKLIVIRENGLVLVNISTFAESVVRQTSISENAKKLRYLSHIEVFLILCKSRNPKNRLKGIDRKSMKLLSTRESTLRNKNPEDSIFGKNEYPISSCIWEVPVGNQRTTKKVLVGCSIISESGAEQGAVKVLDLKKTKSSDGSTVVSIVELTSFEQEGPVTNIQQSNQNIIFASGKRIYHTSYNENEKRLTPVKFLEALPSNIVALDLKDDSLLVTTKVDSIYKYQVPKSGFPLGYISSDTFPNSFINHVEYNSQIVAGDKTHSSISVIELEDKKHSSARRKFKLSHIPRVYLANLNNNWTDTNDLTVLCAGINGELVSFRGVRHDDHELSVLSENLHDGKGSSVSSWDSTLRKLEIPFANKIGGTGLLSMNKPIFDYCENREKLVDYDLNEVSKVCISKISL
ncbi:uncharacterized protein J8A68_005768 [[Candida] subhashii]|uniref:Cleavage/polyadenylation specificity factor A subunit N-terminal domain-containing protein n=1 Tax=[Candida] subhashii TaxID=561895 RepID=A0A8J5Q585_9ASCO|nr:uncharacterized protein J8A68_005768 [[Candida] subhashii]KAG7660651.1 hypothetical protein J8A68_005768 [[Candida] subhashii]